MTNEIIGCKYTGRPPDSRNFHWERWRCLFCAFTFQFWKSHNVDLQWRTGFGCCRDVIRVSVVLVEVAIFKAMFDLFFQLLVVVMELSNTPGYILTSYPTILSSVEYCGRFTIEDRNLLDDVDRDKM